MAAMSKWNTYYVGGYTHDVANDQSSAGGVHLHQVRKTSKGWQKRICQSNGKHQAYGIIEKISDSEGLEKFDLNRREKIGKKGENR